MLIPPALTPGCRHACILMVAVLLTAGCAASVPPPPPDVEGTVAAAVEATLAARPTATPLPTATPEATPTPLPVIVRVTATAEQFADGVSQLIAMEWALMGVATRPWQEFPNRDWLSIRLGRRSIYRIPMPSGSPAVVRWMPLPELCGRLGGPEENCGVTIVVDTPEVVARFVIVGTERFDLGTWTYEWTGLISDDGKVGVVIVHRALGRGLVSRMGRRFLQVTSDLPRAITG